MQDLLKPETVCQHRRGPGGKRMRHHDMFGPALMLKQIHHLLPALCQVGFPQGDFLLHHVLAKTRQQGANTLHLRQRGRQRLRHRWPVFLLQLTLRSLDPCLRSG